MENNARMDERKKGMRKDLLKTKADVEKEGKEPAAVSVTFVRISTKNVFLWTKTQQFKYDDPFQLFNSVCASGRNWVVGSVIFSDWPFSVLCCIKRAKFEMLLNLSVLLITRLTFYIIFNQRKGRRKCVLRSILPFPFSITLYAQQYICVYNLKFTISFCFIINPLTCQTLSFVWNDPSKYGKKGSDWMNWWWSVVPLITRP